MLKTEGFVKDKGNSGRRVREAFKQQSAQIQEKKNALGSLRLRWVQKKKNDEEEKIYAPRKGQKNWSEMLLGKMPRVRDGVSAREMRKKRPTGILNIEKRKETVRSGKKEKKKIPKDEKKLVLSRGGRKEEQIAAGEEGGGGGKTLSI